MQISVSLSEVDLGQYIVFYMRYHNNGFILELTQINNSLNGVYSTWTVNNLVLIKGFNYDRVYFKISKN